jgi:predicted metal-dependent peptidase
MSIPDKLVSAKMLAFHLRPYFASAYHALIPVEDPNLDTLAVDDRWRLYWDRRAIDRWTVFQLATVLYHEVGHLLREHGRRAKPFGSSLNHRVWNVACDCAINDDIVAEIDALAKEGKYKGEREELPECMVAPAMAEYLQKNNPQWKPGGPLTPQLLNMPENKFEEFYYRTLMDRLENDPDLQKIVEGEPGSGDCGSCAHGVRRPYEASGEGTDSDPVKTGLSGADSYMIREQCAKDIKAALNKKAGSVPGGWDRWADTVLKPKVDFMKWLRASIRNAVAEAEGRTDYSWMKQSRRQGAMGSDFFLPGMVGYKPRVGVGIDTSGSMGTNSELAQAVAETKGLLRQLGYQDPVTVVSCDTHAHNVQRITRIDQLKLKGGGGTDMGVALRSLDEMRPKLDVKILLTDCITPWPAERPHGTVVVVKIGKDGTVPPWSCHLVEITPED